jgi:hypothetical protein
MLAVEGGNFALKVLGSLKKDKKEGRGRGGREEATELGGGG